MKILKASLSILIFEYYTASGTDDPAIISEAEEIVRSIVLDLKDEDICVLVSKQFEHIFDDFDYEEFEINPEITDIDDAVSEVGGIEIYPNPTDGLLYINSSSTINKVIVADMTGKIIMDVNGGSDKVELDLSSNPKGIYVLKVISEDDSIVEKIVLE